MIVLLSLPFGRDSCFALKVVIALGSFPITPSETGIEIPPGELLIDTPKRIIRPICFWGHVAGQMGLWLISQGRIRSVAVILTLPIPLYKQPSSLDLYCTEPRSGRAQRSDTSSLLSSKIRLWRKRQARSSNLIVWDPYVIARALLIRLLHVQIGRLVMHLVQSTKHSDFQFLASN